MNYTSINFKDKFTRFNDLWSPKIIAEMNDYQFKLVRFKGDFVWHDHVDTDEAFIVLEGHMLIEFENDTVILKQGELFVVPKGVKHKPSAEGECKILLIEPRGVVNIGEETSELTADNDVWI